MENIIIAIISSSVIVIVTVLGFLYKLYIHWKNKVRFKYIKFFYIPIIKNIWNYKNIEPLIYIEAKKKCTEILLNYLKEAEPLLKIPINQDNLGVPYNLKAFKDIDKVLVKKTWKKIKKKNKEKKWTMDKSQFNQIKMKEKITTLKICCNECFYCVIEKKENYWILYLVKNKKKIQKEIWPREQKT